MSEIWSIEVDDSALKTGRKTGMGQKIRDIRHPRLPVSSGSRRRGAARLSPSCLYASNSTENLKDEGRTFPSMPSACPPFLTAYAKERILRLTAQSLIEVSPPFGKEGN